MLQAVLGAVEMGELTERGCRVWKMEGGRSRADEAAGKCGGVLNLDMGWQGAEMRTLIQMSKCGAV